MDKSAPYKATVSLWLEENEKDLPQGYAPCIEELTPQALAGAFYLAYERLAPTFGCKTRDDTRFFDPKSPDGQLMIAVCGEIIAHISVIVSTGRHYDGIVDNFPIGEKSD